MDHLVADDSQERTEEATPKRKEEARKKGTVARSKDFNTAMLLLAAAVSFAVFGEHMASHAFSIFEITYTANDSGLVPEEKLFDLLIEASMAGLAILVPVFFLCILAIFLGPLLVGKIIFSSDPIKFKLERLNPIKGLAKMVSLKSLMELVKSILKILLVFAFAASLFYFFFEPILGLSKPLLVSGLAKFFDIMQFSFLTLCFSIFIIAGIDIPFQLFQHNKEIKMTKQEVKDEMKETDVKPEIKSKILKVQRDISRQRMMEKVPDADVIITNPTHFAVALKYDDKKMRAPVLLAKGADNVAAKIRQIAHHHQVPIVQLPLLARAIYYNTEINDEIPSRLYVACAQVLAYVYKLKLFKKGKASKPKLPKNITVPKDMVK